MAKVQRVGDLEVYRKLVELHLQVNAVSLEFPKFEMYELGSQLRRSSNSAPANLAEGFNNRHLNVYLEAINRAMGEVRETQHHLMVAHRKRYASQEVYDRFMDDYGEAARMLRGLERSLEESKAPR